MVKAAQSGRPRHPPAVPAHRGLRRASSGCEVPEEPEMVFDGSNPFLPLFQVMFALQEEWNQGGVLDEVCA